MGKASSQKKVARAAGIGGGRTNRGKAPVLWYSSLLVILVAGIGLTAFSRDERLTELNSPQSKEEPRANDSHWHVALGVRVCDRWLDPVTDQADPKGIHGHGDGIIHVHPFVASAAGRRATLERYSEAVKGELAPNRFAWPEGEGKKKVERESGEKCGEQEAEVMAFYNGEPHAGDPGEILLTDRGKLVLAFVPKGTTYDKIGDPPSTSGLDNLSDLSPEEQAKQQQPPQSQEIDPAAGATPLDPTLGAVPGGPPPPAEVPPPDPTTPSTAAVPGPTPSPPAG